MYSGSLLTDFRFFHFASLPSAPSPVFIAEEVFFVPFSFSLFSPRFILLDRFFFPLSFVSVPSSFTMTYSVFLSLVFFFSHSHLYWSDKTHLEVNDGKSHPWMMCNDGHKNTHSSINPVKWLGTVRVVKYASAFIRIWGHKKQNHAFTAKQDLCHWHPLDSAQLDELLQRSLETKFHSEVIQHQWLHHFTHPALMKFSH